MDLSYSRSLVLTPEGPDQNQLHSNKTNQLNWVRLIGRWVVCACMAMLWTGASPAQTSGTKTLEPDPRFAVSVAELKVPNKVWVYLEAAHKALGEGNLEQAAKQTDRALGMDPHCSSAFAMKAFVDLARNHPVDAVQDARRAASVDPYNVEAFVALAMAYNAGNRFPDAQSAAREALRLNSNSWEARLELAKSLYQEQRFDAALAEMDRVRKDFPDVHLVRGNLLMRLGRSKEGAAEFALFVQEAPDDPRVGAVRQIIARAVRSPGP